jgi:hypothetical protein
MTSEDVVNYANIIKNYNYCQIRRSGGYGKYVIMSSSAPLCMKITHNRNPSPHMVVDFKDPDNVSKKELQEKLEICFTNQLGNINFGAVEFFLHRFTQRAKKI